MADDAAVPVALTVAGSDSGGGAGIQADLRAFCHQGIHGTSVVTAVTAQNPDAVIGIYPVPAEFVQQQLRAVLGAFEVAAVKTGMLWSAEVVEATADELAAAALPLVVDPVLVSSSGRILTDVRAAEALVARLVPLATVVTPNLSEAQFLLGGGGDPPLAMARRLADRWQTAVVLKGGHAGGDQRGRDWLVTGAATLCFETAPLAAAAHGTGCAFAAALAGALARGIGLEEAVREAKAYVYRGLRHLRRVGAKAAAMTFPPEDTDASDGVRVSACP